MTATPPDSADREEASTVTTFDSVGEPVQIGPYRILQKIGEGGMGVVYEAEQERPLRRRVALKLIKVGMDTKQVIARFDSERQALALMNHPNIARVFDGGATDTGRPFFVMEYVPGVPITQYCDTQRLSIHERLELFRRVCEAVHHAHQKGIIHRDIKPSNILVTVQDGKPSPKIIDFGVAKATTQQLTEQTLFTQLGQVIGTPAYMSPEQAERTSLDIDTRTDVYSLGVVLYELLVGVLPFLPADLQGAGYEGLRQAIREREPRRPSQRVTDLGESTASVVRSRRIDIRALRHQLHGDLDWIVMKALEKDRTRRYGSASELAADLSRHQNHQPVLAAHPGATYRMLKFVRRHRVGVAAGAVVVLALLGGIVGTTLGLLRALRAEEAARAEAETARQVSEFLVGLFRVSDPAEARGKTVTAREILDQGTEQITSGLADRPLIRARLMDTMGEVYMNLGLYEPAGGLLEQALDIRRNNLDENQPDLASSLSHLGELRTRQARYVESRPLQEQALAIRERVLGPDHPDTAWSLYHLAALLMRTGDYQRAIGYYRRALPIFEARLGPEHYAVSWCLNDLGGIHTDFHEYDSARGYFERALKIKEKSLGPDHPDVAIGLTNLGFVLMMQRRYAEAEPLLRRSIAVAEKSLEPGHPWLVKNLSVLGDLLRRSRRFVEARKVLERALTSTEGRGQQDPWPMDDVLETLARLDRDTGNLAEAEAFYRRALPLKERVLAPDHLEIADTLTGLADILHKTGRHEEAQRLEARAKAIRARSGEKAPK